MGRKFLRRSRADSAPHPAETTSAGLFSLTPTAAPFLMAAGLAAPSLGCPEIADPEGPPDGKPAGTEPAAPGADPQPPGRT